MEILVLVTSHDRAKALSVCSGLRADSNGRPIACETAGLDEAPERAALLRPHVLLLEASSRADHASPLMTRLRHGSPGTRTLLLVSGSLTRDLVVNAIRDGALGCVQDTEAPAVLAKAGRPIHGGESWFGRGVLYQALHGSLCPSAPASVVLAADEANLTPREREILDLIGAGLSNKEIGRRLEISDKTVKTHLHRVYVKLNRSGRYKALLMQPRAQPAAQDLRWATLERLTGPADPASA